MFSQKLKPGMIWMQTPPLAQYEKSPEVDFSKYKNFAVFPQAELKKKTEMNPIVEKQLLFMLRNGFESLGYNYVNNVEDVDFFIAIYYTNEYKNQYIPPSTVTIPWYVPGQTQTTFINNYSNISGYIGSDYFYGSGSGWGTATTTTPGYYVPMSMTKPGSYVGWYYPCIFVSVFDKNSKGLVWSGSVIGTTSESDIRLSTQVLLSDLFGRKEPHFPICSDFPKRDDSGDGIFGINPFIYTIDGNNFYPMIGQISIKSPAHKGGLKPGDIITHVDKQSTLNQPLSQCINTFNKSKEESIVLTIQRGNKIFDVTLMAEDEEIAKKEWKEILTRDEKWNIKRMKIPKPQ